MYLNNKFIKILPIISIYLSSCANQSTPTGGAKDETPPELILSIPENETLNYKDQKIVLEFDEYIKLNNPKEEIIITPRLTGKYEIIYKKKKVIIEIEDSLQSNTTYSFIFREAIEDFNEGNTPPDLQLAFSTGNYIDSLTLSGNVYHLLSNQPGENMLISLYDPEDTLDVFNSPPVYFTKSNSLGEFTFKNLKHGNYKIYALNDKNKNLILESKNEEYAYLNYNIQLDSNLHNIKLPLINLDHRPLELQKATTRGHYFLLKYNKYVSSFTQKTIDESLLTPPYSYSKDHKEIIYYNTNIIKDSLGVIIEAYDTINNLKTDTVYIKFDETKRKKETFDINYTKTIINKETPTINTKISFNKPILSVNLDSIYLQIDSTTQIKLDTNNIIWNNQRTILTINKNLEKTHFEEENNNNPLLYFGNLAFLSVEQDSSIQHLEKTSFINPTTKGDILVKIETDSLSFITQLLNTKGVIIAENYNQKQFRYKNITPGTYKLRVLIDSNQNKQWDIGDINKTILPEPVVFYVSKDKNTEITLRANWELGPNIIKF